MAAHRQTRPEAGPASPPGEKPEPAPDALPVEPDLGPVPAPAHPDEPGAAQPEI